MLRLFVRLHEMYEDNLLLWDSGRRLAVEYSWREAFRAAELGERWWLRPHDAALHALRRAVRAHICEDLPRALATTFHEEYEATPGLGYDSFHEDYVRMNPVFETAARLLRRELPNGPLGRRVMDRLMPERLRQVLLRQSFFDVRKERRRAWERGRGLLALLQESATGSQASLAAPMDRSESAVLSRAEPRRP